MLYTSSRDLPDKMAWNIFLTSIRYVIKLCPNLDAARTQKKAVKPCWNYRLEISIENKNLLVGYTRNH